MAKRTTIQIRENILDSEIRRQIYDLLKESSVMNIAMLAKKIGVYSRAIAYHVSLMEKLGYLHSTHLGNDHLFAINEITKQDQIDYLILKTIKLGAMLKYLKEHGKTRICVLSEKTNVKLNSVQNYFPRLLALGFVEKEKKGKETYYSLKVSQ